MAKKVFHLPANGIEFYCEMRGTGPLVLLVPDGCNDCGPYDNLSLALSTDFTVVTFDMRGGTRSMDHRPQKVTPSVLGDDVAGIIEALGMGPASIYGCSSGGQAVLAAAKRHPSLIRNVLVHEAALQGDTPLPGAGFRYFENIFSFQNHFNSGLTPSDFWGICNAEKALGLTAEVRARLDENAVFWGKWYLGTVDTDSYTAEDLERMPPVDFTVGTWTPAWLVYANLATAARGKYPVRWFNCAHHPEITCPIEYAQYMCETIKKYL